MFGCGRRLEALNALARTCKTLYVETKGLVLKENNMKFECSNMFDDTKTPDWICERGGFTRAIKEALAFINDFGPQYSTLSQHVRIRAAGASILARFFGGVDGFSQVMGMLQGVKVEIRCWTWGVKMLSEPEMIELGELEEDGEPFEHLHDQMRKRIDSYLKDRIIVGEFVEEMGGGERNWRVFPEPLAKEERAEIFSFMTVDEQEKVRIWKENGV